MALFLSTFNGNLATNNNFSGHIHKKKCMAQIKNEELVKNTQTQIN